MSASPASSPEGAAAAPETPVQTWVRYTHLDKVYGHLPGLAGAQAQIFGLDEEEYAAVRSGYARAAAAAAEQLLADAALAPALDRLPFVPGEVVLAVGDSITDDLQSWCEILRAVLAVRAPAVRLVNGGLSAHTSAMVLRRWPALLRTVRPDWVLCGLGGNDVTRVGPPPAKCQVSPEESVANLRELRRIAAAVPDDHWIWLTPAPVDERRVAAFAAFAFGQSSWAADDVAALADRVRAFDEPVVDLLAAVGDPASSPLLGEDGVHPTLAGQTAIARAVVRALATG